MKPSQETCLLRKTTTLRVMGEGGVTYVNSPRSSMTPVSSRGFIIFMDTLFLISFANLK